MELLYIAIGFCVFWVFVTAIGCASLLIAMLAFLHVNRARKILSRFGKAKDKPYWLCLFLVWRASLTESPSSTSYNGLYFPMIGKPYYKDYEED